MPDAPALSDAPRAPLTDAQAVDAALAVDPNTCPLPLALDGEPPRLLRDQIQVAYYITEISLASRRSDLGMRKAVAWSRLLLSALAREQAANPLGL